MYATVQDKKFILNLPIHLDKYLMQISELLFELDFQGSPCTRDCSGHSAGYAWSMKHANKNCDSKNASFNNGCNIAKKQIASKNIKRPVVSQSQQPAEPNSPQI